DMGVDSAGAGEATIRVWLEGPGMIYPAGSRVLVQVATAQGFELTGPPELAVEVEGTPSQAEAFARDYLRFINPEFTSRMSQNFVFYHRGIERDNPLTRALARILKFDPGNERALELLHWARIEPWPEFTRQPEGPADFPEVVKEARMAALEARDVIHWWIDQRQDETGYMVGRADMWNDDTKLFNEYSFLWLLSGDQKLAGAMEKYLAAHWASGRMVKGWSGPWTDIVHSAEEASYLEPTMAMVDYGDPLHIEQLMQTAANVDYWTGVNDFGHRHFRSSFFTAEKMKTEGEFGRDVGLNATAMTASMYLAWYCHQPRATEEFLQWVDAWVADSMRETPDKPAGRIPSWIDFATDTLGADQEVYPSEITMMMEAAYQLTGDRKYLQPMLAYLRSGDARWPQYLNMAAADLRRDLGTGDYDDLMRTAADLRAEQLNAGSFFQRGMYDQELPCVLGWMVTGDDSYLQTGARNAWRCNWFGRNIYTLEDAHKDRVYPWGPNLLPWMYCGGNALNRRGSGPWPTVNVSWVDAGYDFAALVHEADRGHLRLTAYNFAGAREVGMRIWRMDPGVYEVTITPRAGEPQTRLAELQRGEVVRFDLPAESWADVELVLRTAGDWSPERPDLALSAREPVPIEGGVATVTVHNIGSVDAPECTAVLMTGDRRLGETRVPPIPAPLDLQPRTAEVSFELPRARVDDLRVIIDPEDQVPEVTELNNSVLVGV
ncbi:MAG TPA: CARDB domain-containing protein, partial [Armatimonadota bacterium]|nr:CARDB domain-containing protein [Armatimonadota bacterium]